MRIPATRNAVCFRRMVVAQKNMYTLVIGAVRPKIHHRYLSVTKREGYDESVPARQQYVEVLFNLPLYLSTSASIPEDIYCANPGQALERMSPLESPEGPQTSWCAATHLAHPLSKREKSSIQ